MAKRDAGCHARNAITMPPTWRACNRHGVSFSFAVSPLLHWASALKTSKVDIREMLIQPSFNGLFARKLSAIAGRQAAALRQSRRRPDTRSPGRARRTGRGWGSTGHHGSATVACEWVASAGVYSGGGVGLAVACLATVAATRCGFAAGDPQCVLTSGTSVRRRGRMFAALHRDDQPVACRMSPARRVPGLTRACARAANMKPAALAQRVVRET